MHYVIGFFIGVVFTCVVGVILVILDLEENYNSQD